MKPLGWVGDTKRAVRNFPEDARNEAGHQLWRIQMGREPDDWKPMPSIGAGVREIRIREPSGAFQVVYIASISQRCRREFTCFTRSRRRHRKPKSTTSNWQARV